MDGARVGLEINRKSHIWAWLVPAFCNKSGVFSALASFENVYKVPSHLVSSQFSLNKF